MMVALETLGCKLNQAETESLARQLVAAGYRLVPPAAEADAYILNTCTVTQAADAKSRHLLRLAHRRNPEALVVATGCYAQRTPTELAQIEGVTMVVGNDEKPYLSHLLQEYANRKNTDLAPTCLTEGQSAFRTRAFIKVQQGCSSFCAYCIVPRVRGREKSLPMAQVLAEVGQRLAQGCREVVLTGTEIGLYHDDGTGLKGLLERLLLETEVTRLRLSSLQPQEISPEFLALWQDRRLCPHFHLSLQSGSDAVLRRMKRRYSVNDYKKAVSLIRARLPGAAITTDIIVGFPGETEAEFSESLELCRQLDFARIHVFAYSRRQGTPAAQFPRQVSDKIKKERSQQMLALARESARNFQRQFLGQVRPVLWEQQSAAGVWSGYTDNYIKVSTRSDRNLTNLLLPVKLMRASGDRVWGEVDG